MKQPHIKLVLADDHALFRSILVEILKNYPRMSVVAQAAAADEVLDLIERTDMDVLVLDISMPGANRTSLIRTVHQKAPELAILVLSMHDETCLVREALRSGARGYVTKDTELDFLEAAILAVAQGDRYVSPQIEGLLLDEEAEATDDDPLAALTAREREILQLMVGDGLPLVQIADQLQLSPKTVTTHKANIMRKLRVSTNADLMQYVYSRSPP
jgi:RNA polymerase sigma factor (sigma-70 family)